MGYYYYFNLHYKSFHRLKFKPSVKYQSFRFRTVIEINFVLVDRITSLDLKNTNVKEHV